MQPATSIATIALSRFPLLLAVGLAAAGCSADEEALATTEEPLLHFELNCRTLDAHASYLQSRGFNLGTAYPERALPDGGRVRQYANAVLYWSPSTCAREVHGPIFGRYFWMGQQASEVGYPTSDTFPLTSSVSARSLFQRGAIYWKPELGARVVTGPSYDKYVSLGRERWLGFPTSDTGPTTTGYGQATSFEYGVIYHHVNLGAHVVYGAILGKWTEMGRERSRIGLPVTDELGVADGVGRYNLFEGGALIWHPHTGAHLLVGGMREKWFAIPPHLSIGYPVTDDAYTANEDGKFVHFQSGSMYGRLADLKFYFLRTQLRDKWFTRGAERGTLGWPMSDETSVRDGWTKARFQHSAAIYAHPAVGSFVVGGQHGVEIMAAYQARGSEDGSLGFPTSDEQACGGQVQVGNTIFGGKRVQSFQGGSIMSWWETAANSGVYYTKSDVSSAQRSCASPIPAAQACSTQFTVCLRCPDQNTTLTVAGCDLEDAKRKAMRWGCLGVSDDACPACGGPGQVCCDVGGIKACESGFGVDLHCDTSLSPSGACYGCGKLGQACCEEDDYGGGACEPGTSCNGSTCEL